MFKTILVPTDGSEHSGKAVEIASDLASKYDARMVLLHVITDYDVPDALVHFAAVEGVPEAKTTQHVEPVVAGPPHAVVGLPKGSKKHMDRHAVMHDVASKVLEEARFLAEQRGVKSVEVVTAEGDAAKQILESAEHEHVDGIVMGSRGLSDLKGAIMGSVSHKVCHDAGCTCITVS